MNPAEITPMQLTPRLRALSDFLAATPLLWLRCAGEGGVSAATRDAGGSFSTWRELPTGPALPWPDGAWPALLVEAPPADAAELPSWAAELRRIAGGDLAVVAPAAAGADRAAWERVFFAAGFRKHPLYQAVTPYAALEQEGPEVVLMLTAIPAEGAARYPLAALEAERDLHNDMSRVSGRRSDAHIARYMLAREYLPESGLVLDAACGLGYGCAVLAHGRPDLAIVGLDCSEFAVRYGEATFGPAQANVRFQVGDVCDLGAFADGSVGLVVSFETVEHLREPERFFAEVRRVLRPDGNFICSVPNEWVDEHGEDPNPWHFHVFDFVRITTLCARYLQVRDVFNQTAGGGMKLPRAPRRIRRVNLPMTQRGDDAEWWLVAASRERVVTTPASEPPSADRVLVLTHDAAHPLYTSWLGQCPHPVIYETRTGVDFAFPERVGLVIAADCYREPRATLLCRAMEQGIPTLLLADGILEYRNTFEHPDLAPGAIFQPALAHKVACLGRSQARILESWGNAGQVEVTGSARFDRYAALRRRERAGAEPFTVLVVTAITPYFTPEQHEQVRRALLDMKAFFAAHAAIGSVPVRVEWRVTKGLDAEIGVESVASDLSGRQLAEVLPHVDAVVSTPSTTMVEAMLLGLPVAVLDYGNAPHYVQPAWRITAPGHIGPVLAELVAPPAPKLLFQETTLHDTLECATPAAPRLLALVERMLAIGRAARAAGVAPVFPDHLLGGPAAAAAPAENRFVPAELYRGAPAFREPNPARLQVEVGQLRAYAAQLERAGAATAAPDAAEIRRQVQAAVAWRAKVEAAAALQALGQSKVAVDLLLQALKIVQVSQHAETILEALLEVCGRLRTLDPARTGVLVETAGQLARRMQRADALAQVEHLRASLPQAQRLKSRAA